MDIEKVPNRPPPKTSFWTRWWCWHELRYGKVIYWQGEFYCPKCGANVSGMGMNG